MHFSHDLCSAILVPLLPSIRTEFELNYMQSGMLISAYNIASAASQFLGGWLGSRYRLQLIVALGIACVGLSTLATGFSLTYYTLLFLLIIMGIFSGGYHPASNSMLSNYFEVNMRGKIVGLHMLGGTLAGVLGPILGGLIADRLNWHFAFIILCLPAIFASLLVLSVLKKFRQLDVESTNRAFRKDVNIAQVMPRRIGILQVWQPIIIVVTLTLLSQMVAGAAIAFIPMYFVDKGKVAAIAAATFLGILRLGGIPGSLFGGWLTDKLGGRKAVIVALAATGPFLFLITRLPVNFVLLVALFFLGGIFMIRQTAIQTFLMDNTPLQIRSVVFGIYFGLIHQASSVVQPVIGYLADIFGIARVFDFVALISVALSLAALLLIRPQSRQLS